MKKKPQDLTDDDVDTIIQLKWGRLVDSQFHRAFLSNAALGKLFKCSHESIRQAYLARFEANAEANGTNSSKHPNKK